MEKTPKELDLPAEDTEPSYEITSAIALREVFRTDAGEVLNQKLREISQLLWHPSGASKSEVRARIARAVELYESLVPADGVEGMLALQMVGTHEAGLECLRRAALANETFEGRDLELKHAHKLMTLFAQQLATLDKHRGKGQQKVTVEHVNVEAGGQAIVGNVETGQSGRSKKQTPPEIEHAPEVPMPNVKSKSKVARKRSK